MSIENWPTWLKTWRKWLQRTSKSPKLPKILKVAKILKSCRKSQKLPSNLCLSLPHSEEGFPYQLSPMKTKTVLPISAVNFTEAAPSLKKIFNNQINICVIPDLFFVPQFREVFQKNKLRHTSADESEIWLGWPNMKYWPQELNFAVFCSTQGCGISRETFGSGLTLPLQIMAFYKFHVYFTARWILYQPGGIQRISALPGDPTFNQFNNHYDVASYNRLCNEFGIKPSSDFRFASGKKNTICEAYTFTQQGLVQWKQWLQ